MLLLLHTQAQTSVYEQGQQVKVQQNEDKGPVCPKCNVKKMTLNNTDLASFFLEINKIFGFIGDYYFKESKKNCSILPANLLLY